MFHYYVKGAKTFFQVSWILLSEVTGYLLSTSTSKEEFLESLTERLASINILYVKIFQAIALNNNIIDESMNNTLLKFTDNAPWNNDDIDYDTLIELNERFDIFFPTDYAPINSGMISLVFKCMIHFNNEIIIVKCKRKNIDEKLNDAIENLRVMMYFLSCFPIIKKYNISDIVEKNIGLIKEQLCFKNEVKNLLLIKNNCKHLKYIKIPSVNVCVTEEFPNIIVMECINGLPVHMLQKDHYIPFAKTVMKFGFVTTLIHGATHGDLHSGNILFIRDDSDTKYPYKIGVIDFGILLKIDNLFKNKLFEIISELFTLHPKVIAEKILSSGIIEPLHVIEKLNDEHKNAIIEMLTNIIENTVSTSKQANQIKIYEFLNNFHAYIKNNELHELGLRPSENFVKTQLALAMAHGVTMTLCENDYFNLADQVINELFRVDLLGLN